MIFGIQTGAPLIVPDDVNEQAQNLSDAMTLIYTYDTEMMVLSWNDVVVAADYQDDVYVFIDDVVLMLEALRDPDVTAYRMSFVSQTFNAVWRIQVRADGLVIRSSWDAAPGGYEFLLNERSELTVNRDFFVAEWKKLLRKVVADVEAKNVRMEDTMMFDRAKALIGAAEGGS
jgi:hypothetical protein